MPFIKASGIIVANLPPYVYIYGVNLALLMEVIMPAIKTSERLTARVPENVYSTIAQAAELVGATINQFLVQAALEKASSIIEKEHTINLTMKSAEVFFEAVSNPPEPSPALIKAVKDYNERMEN